MAEITNADIEFVTSRLPAGAPSDKATVLQRIQATGSPEAALADFWDTRSVETSAYMTISESGSSRSMGDIHKNALAMAKMWRSRAEEKIAAQTPASDIRPARMRPLKREGGF